MYLMKFNPTTNIYRLPGDEGRTGFNVSEAHAPAWGDENQ
jgi:hypothetical protein